MTSSLGQGSVVMLRNYLVTALRNLAAQRALRRHQHPRSGDSPRRGLADRPVRPRGTVHLRLRWIPGYQQVFKITNDLRQPGQPGRIPPTQTNALIAGNLRAAFAGGVEDDRARPLQDFPIKACGAGRRGHPGSAEQAFAWADLRDVFKGATSPAESSPGTARAPPCSRRTRW